MTETPAGPLSAEAPDGVWDYDAEHHWLMFTERDSEGYGATAIVAFDVQLHWAARLLDALRAATRESTGAGLPVALLRLAEELDRHADWQVAVIGVSKSLRRLASRKETPDD